ncbi:MAG: DNA-primase RepB domain-containing protein [Thermofilaceae archaeon]
MYNDKGGIKPEVAVDFLEQIWMYTSGGADCYAIVVIKEEINYRHFCLSELGDYWGLLRAIKQYLSRIDPGAHVYYQVLPLAVKPSKGRGSEKDVRIGRWLWVDLDYKETVDKASFEGCKELEDYALECYYEDSGKIIHVSRPPLSEVLNQVRGKLGLEPYYVVDSGAGYHLYFKLTYEVGAATLKKLEEWLVNRLGGDPQSKDLARILRLPGAINPRTQRLVQVIHHGSQEVDPEALLQRVEAERETPREKPKHALEKPRELSDSEILRITELLREAYKPGYRQFLLLYLSGWLAKAGISPVSAVRIVKALYESTEDTDPIKTRLSAVVYSYKKAGINVDEYASEIENIAGVKPYGLEREISEEAVKGKTGLQEILESILGEDRALSIIHELSEILQTLSPYRDSIIELVDYEKQLYAVANLRKLIIVRARRESNRLVYKERIAVVCPTRVVVYNNPIGGITKYEVTFEGATLQRPLTIGPAIIDEIADRLAAEGVVYHRRLIHDTLSAIIQAYVRKEKAEIRTEIESPGFYLVDGRVITVKYSVESVDTEKLKQALTLLNELAEVWFKHVQDKFSTIVKWGAVAPFGYILKQRGKWVPWLYLYGDSATGKTTLGKIVLKLWGLDSRYEKTGASVDTVPRLGHVLSASTFPTLINEPGNALTKEDVAEAVKNAVDNVIVRGKYIKGTYTEIPALSCLIFTSNKFLPRDDALLRRFKVITFSYGEKIPVEKQREFKEKADPRLNTLSEIGKCIAKQVLETQGLDHLDGRILLEKCYEFAGLEKPQWLNLEYNEALDLYETVLEEFIERFKKYINDLFARYVSRIIEIDRDNASTNFITPDTVDMERKLRILLEKHMLPGVKLSGNEVLVTTVLLDEIGLRERVNLKSLAEMLGCEYGVFWASGRSVRAMKTQVEKLVEVLTG